MQFSGDLWEYEWAVTPEGRLLLIGIASVLGGVLGSFMNVVVYRLPRRMSLSRPGSRCPKCEHPIRWHDNVPVLGWLMLRGRCRDCGAPIAARYPLIEALVAVSAALLAWRMPLLEGVSPADGMPYYVVDFSQFLLQLLLVCVLYCAALIEFDGFVPPGQLVAWPLLAGFGMLVVWPHLLPAAPGYGGLPLEGVVAALFGVFGAVLLGVGPALAWSSGKQPSAGTYAATALAELALIGAFLGQRAVTSIGPEAMLVYVITRLLALKWPAAERFGWAGPLALATLAWLLVPRDVVSLELPLSDDWRWRLGIAVPLMCGLALVARLVPIRQKSPSP